MLKNHEFVVYEKRETMKDGTTVVAFSSLPKAIAWGLVPEDSKWISLGSSFPSSVLSPSVYRGYNLLREKVIAWKYLSNISCGESISRTISRNIYPVIIAAFPLEPNQFAVGLTDDNVHVIEPIDRKWRCIRMSKQICFLSGPRSKSLLDNNIHGGPVAQVYESQQTILCFIL
jgi:hypothetical protein